MIEYPPDKPCPCGRRKKYKNCCSKRMDVIYYIDDSGKAVKSMPISAALNEAIDYSAEEFKAIFGREMNRGDLFINEAFLYSDEEFIAMMAESMISANIPSDLVFAFIKTNGVIVSDKNKDHIHHEDFVAFQTAIKEYYDIIEKGKDPFGVFAISTLGSDFDEIFEGFRDHIKHIVFSIGYVILDSSNFKDLSETDRFSVVIFLRLVESLRSIYKGIFRLDNADWHSIRLIYECVVRLRAVNADTSLSRSFLAQSSLGNGDGLIRKHNGKRVIALMDGSLIDFPPGIRSLIARFDQLGKFDSFHIRFYDFTSSWAHPGFDTAKLHFSTDGRVMAHGKVSEIDLLLAAQVVCKLTCAVMMHATVVREQRKSDVKFITERLNQTITNTAALVSRKGIRCAIHEIAFENNFIYNPFI